MWVEHTIIRKYTIAKCYFPTDKVTFFMIAADALLLPTKTSTLMVAWPIFIDIFGNQTYFRLYDCSCSLTVKW